MAYNEVRDSWTDVTGRTTPVAQLEDDHLINVERFLRGKPGFRAGAIRMRKELEYRSLEPAPGWIEVPRGFRVRVGNNLKLDLEYDFDSPTGGRLMGVQGKTIQGMFIGGIGDCFLHIDFSDGTFIHLGVNDLGWWDAASKCRHQKGA